MAHENSSRHSKRLACGLWMICLLLRVNGSRGETVIDSCGFVHNQRTERHSVTMRSYNFVVDSEDSTNFAGDKGRFKRAIAEPGHLTYTSPRGFENLTITGYVFGPLPENSWSLSIHVGDAKTAMNQTFQMLTMTKDNFDTYKSEAGANDWQQFVIVLSFGGQCPPRVSVQVRGAATNNEYPGWGVQLGQVVLVQSWYAGCKVPCKFQKKPCADGRSRQEVDPVRDFRNVFLKTSNLEIDKSDAYLYFEGDNGRIKRSNNKPAGLIYSSSQSIREVVIEMFQYKPFDTAITVQPFLSESCMPITLTPTFTAASGKPSGGWIHRIASIDLTSLPLCTKRLAINITGGREGWELQISRVTFDLVGELEANPAYVKRASDEESGGGTSKTWWIWLTALLGSAFAFLLLAVIIRRVALCCGDDETSVYHISNLPYFRRHRRGPPALPDTPAIQQETTGRQARPAKDISFSFAQIA